MIIDTDDDNFPYEEKWSELMTNETETLYLEDQQELTIQNVYTHFSKSEQSILAAWVPVKQVNARKFSDNAR